MELHDEIRLGRRPVKSLKSRRDRLHARPRVSYPDRPMFTTKGKGACQGACPLGGNEYFARIPEYYSPDS